MLAEQVRQLLRRHTLAFVGHRDRHVNAILYAAATRMVDASGECLDALDKRLFRT